MKKILLLFTLHSDSMSRIISLSVDNDFADDLDNLIEKSGYKNRSRFLRDAALFFAEIQQRGELMNMPDNIILELTVEIEFSKIDSNSPFVISFSKYSREIVFLVFTPLTIQSETVFSLV